MKTESNTRPEPVTIRKLGVIDTEPVVYLYLNSDITQEVKPDIDGEPRTMYVYDMVQITSLMPLELLQEVDTTLIENHSYNQTTEKQLASTHLDKIRTRLGEATAENTRQVNRLDKLTTPKQVDLDNIKNRVLATKKTTPTTS